MSAPASTFKSFDPMIAMATAGGLGYVPIAPGTIGAMIGVAVSYGIFHLPSARWQFAVVLFIWAVGVPVCGYASRKLGNSDPKEVIWDELATVPMVFTFLPADQVLHPPTLLLGFALHRVFDIAKPPPIKQLERLPDGWGIMADDVGAAAYACIALHSLRYLLSW